MKVLWLCNIMLPMVARQLNMESSNKEGWLSGLADVLLESQKENGIELSLAFPLGKGFRAESWTNGAAPLNGGAIKIRIVEKGVGIDCYGFPEDVTHAERYDASLEESMGAIVEDAGPDIVHCFGTEYPHTLAMCRIFPRKERILAGLQGLCTLYAQAYYADLPGRVIHSATLRDMLKQDSLTQQKKKFEIRGEMERESIALAGNITGRTLWDREFKEKWNKGAKYFHMNETLRKEFYGSIWKEEKCIPHSIFVSQGDYPLKGLHYVLNALPAILDEYPDTKVYVAGNSIVRCGTAKERLKLSAYGKYLLRLMRGNALEEKITFLGRLDAGQMRDRYLVSHLYLCPSALENSPNSLGEAMLMGMPCVSARVGGISSLFSEEEGILYEGFRMEGGNAGEETDRISNNLADAVVRMWGNPGKMREFCANARKRALALHEPYKNYKRLVDIYGMIYHGVGE